MLILSRDQFRQLVEERTQQMKVEMAPFPQVTTHWVKPFDDPEAEFTPLYLTLVGNLRKMVTKQDRVLKFGPFLSFEADHYHLNISDDKSSLRRFSICSQAGPLRHEITSLFSWPVTVVAFARN